jgi:predicted dehydrogenase
LMRGVLPKSVTAVVQRLKDDATYARVDDEATIILTYANAQAIVQGSWNWPDHRKDLEIFGTDGYIFTPNANNVRMRLRGEPTEKVVAPAELDRNHGNCFTYLAAVVRGELPVIETDRSSLTNNLTVVRILEAARRSAQSQRTIVLES